MSYLNAEELTNKLLHILRLNPLRCVGKKRVEKVWTLLKAIMESLQKITCRGKRIVLKMARFSHRAGDDFNRR